MTSNMKTKTAEFEVSIPNLDGTEIAERVKVPVTLEWDEEIKEWLLTPEAHQVIENTKARRIGLLLPDQLMELRQQYNYTQKEMGELFQVGEKSWTRWETGKHRPSRSINLLIRALYEGEISVNYLLKRAGKPPREVEATPETPHWIEMCPLGIAMNYVAIEANRRIQLYAPDMEKSDFWDVLMGQTGHKSKLTRPGMAKPRSNLEHTGQRFDYQNVRLA